jgi:hypothetical protein
MDFSAPGNRYHFLDFLVRAFSCWLALGCLRGGRLGWVFEQSNRSPSSRSLLGLTVDFS